MRVLLTVTSLLPTYGGPAFSVSKLAIALANAGIEVGLWASDQSARTTPLLVACSRLHPLVGNVEQALDRFGKPDILHDNGIWLAHNHRLAVLAQKYEIPRVVSTRGMLEPWAFQHKQLKKRIAWKLYQRQDLELALCHHTTADTEARHLQRFRFCVPIITVPNGVEVSGEGSTFANAQAQHNHPNTKRIALFLGRIYPIKGLPMLIEAWARVRPKGWTLHIAGPDEAGHQKEVERAVYSAGLREVVIFTGPLSENMKAKAFSSAELFLLPSHSESFGMAVAEALAHGVPVLTTTRTPWSVLRENGCGWWVDATVGDITQALTKATMLDSDSLFRMGAKGRALVAEHFGWKRIAERFLSSYSEIINRPVIEEHMVRYRNVHSDACEIQLSNVLN